MSDVRRISFLQLIYPIIFAACVVPSVSHAQKITDVDFQVTASIVKISYAVTACSGNEDYDVKVLLGQDGQLSEIGQGLSGDLEHVTCGSSNTIVWDVLADREELKGPVYFAVEILRTHAIVSEEPIIAYDDEDGRPAGAVPYGDPMATYAPQQRSYAPGLGFLQVASWIIFEQARYMAARGRPVVVIQKHGNVAASRPPRHR